MARISPLVLVPPAVFAALAGLFLSGMFGRDSAKELPSALIGQAAPALPTAGIEGYPPIDPSILTDGEVKLVNFFASWCPPCRVEHPTITALAEEGIPIYGVAYNDDPANTAAFLEELGNPFRAIGSDRDRRTLVNWGGYGIPETFVLSGDGTVIDRMPFPLTPELVESRLRPALARAAE